MAKKVAKNLPERRPVYLDLALHARLKARADAEGRSIGWLAGLYVQSALDRADSEDAVIRAANGDAVAVGVS